MHHQMPAYAFCWMLQKDNEPCNLSEAMQYFKGLANKYPQLKSQLATDAAVVEPSSSN